ncbi:uncharacterized protein BCR38DRAFT_446794 [Pseudomassariella vexata]|uniref:C2H2-type domain-containing protein n=1 Tax=Pseudomassariella vexata TaxID=1141098 RepID=A0A1Y2DHZ3_9PEZI|nr:uncharacterized protein BCR38DRAFT_446794 [Pseudomassariella vexata]ORY58859.1 hypothetical protein BCR38DRAFT_446794 [Pseudomassariella vexata]
MDSHNNAFRCEDCNASFPTRPRAAQHAGLTRHMSSRHCYLCQKLFDHPRSLKQHEKSSPRHNTSLFQSHTLREQQRPSYQPYPESTDTSDSAAAAETHRQQRIATPTLATGDGATETIISVHKAITSTNETGVTRNSALNKSSPDSAPRVYHTEHPHVTRSSLVPSQPGIIRTATRRRTKAQASSVTPSTTELAMHPGTTALQPKASNTLPQMARALSTISRDDTESLSYSQLANDQNEKEPQKASSPEPPLPAPTFITYPTLQILPINHQTHGKNQYTLYSEFDQGVLFEALLLRCHTRGRLTANRFILPGQSERERIVIPKGMKESDFQSSPARSRLQVKRKVVALDCEMVGILHREGDDTTEISELAQLCAVDVLTGETLINKFVCPYVRVSNWRTRYSGITPAAMSWANKNGESLRGWRAAREELLKYIDSETILIGHSMTNDLKILRLVHGKVIDTSLQTAEVVHGDGDKLRRIWSLKELAKVLLGMNIQVGKKGHDCLEDTLATREIALWCLRFPQELETWALTMREMLECQRIEREKKLAEERKTHEEEKKKREAEEAEEKRREAEEYVKKAAWYYDLFYRSPGAEPDSGDEAYEVEHCATG